MLPPEACEPDSLATVTLQSPRGSSFLVYHGQKLYEGTKAKVLLLRAATHPRSICNNGMRDNAQTGRTQLVGAKSAILCRTRSGKPCQKHGEMKKSATLRESKQVRRALTAGSHKLLAALRGTNRWNTRMILLWFFRKWPPGLRLCRWCPTVAAATLPHVEMHVERLKEAISIAEVDSLVIGGAELALGNDDDPQDGLLARGQESGRPSP